MVITFANTKGGSGKSTVCLNIAEYLAADPERRVTVVDTDVQGSLSGLAAARVRNSAALKVALPNITFINAFFDPAETRQKLTQLVQQYHVDKKTDFVLIDIAGVYSEAFDTAASLSDDIITPIRPNPADARAYRMFALKLQSLRSQYSGLCTYGVVCQKQRNITQQKETEQMIRALDQHICRGPW